MKKKLLSMLLLQALVMTATGQTTFTMSVKNKSSVVLTSQPVTIRLADKTDMKVTSALVTLDGKEIPCKGFACCGSAAELGPVDAVILMVKATQTAAVLPALRGCLGAETVVVSLQNGLDNDRILKDFVDPGRILCGFGRIGTELPAPGLCVAKPEEGVVMRFGPLRENERLVYRPRYTFPL